MPQLGYLAVLTYPKKFPLNGKIVKDHLHKIKLRLSYRNIKLFWFMEFQRRGAAHFNLVLDNEVEGLELKRIWYEIVGSNDPKHLEHGVYIAPIRSREGSLHYLTGYLTKQEQKAVPKDFEEVGRFWGYSLSLLPHTTKIIFGTPDEIRKFRRSFRAIRRWIESQKRNWKSKRKHRKRKNLYSLYLPAEYLTVRNGRKWIDEMESRGFDMSLFK